MPLNNPRHEQFAQLIAGGRGTTDAYLAAGYSVGGAAQAASKLRKLASVDARIRELQACIADAATTRAALSREWVLDRLRLVVERSLQIEPPRGKTGTVEGEFTFHAAGANRALELIGRELGMFIERTDNTNRYGSLREVPAEVLDAWIAEAEAEETAKTQPERALATELQKLQ